MIERKPNVQGWWAGLYGDYNIDEEPLVETFHYGGQEVGLCTRNRYDALVLNAFEMLAIDVDLGDPRRQDGCFTSDATVALNALQEAIALPQEWGGTPLGTWYCLMMGGRFTKYFDSAKDLLGYPGIPILEDFEVALKSAGPCIYKLEAASSAAKNYSDSLHYGLGFRVYRTAGGLRYICTTHPFQPWGKSSNNLMRYVYADPRYRRLCREHRTYRMRLTPKPWRSASESDCACQFVDVVGNDLILPQFQALVQYHDLITQANADTGCLA